MRRLAILGLTDQYVHERISHHKYSKHVTMFQLEVAKFNTRPLMLEAEQRSSARDRERARRAAKAKAKEKENDDSVSQSQGQSQSQSQEAQDGEKELDEAEAEAGDKSLEFWDDNLVEMLPRGFITFEEEYVSVPPPLTLLLLRSLSLSSAFCSRTF